MDKSILIIYTGGTIGMINDSKTGALCPFDFDRIAKEVPEINEFDFKIDTITLPKLIDSSDQNPEVWASICDIIIKNYDKHNGFVVLHGTDTMSYSASALSFMLNDLKKPVIFTGSQLPIGMIRTDGKENLITALEIAAAERDGFPIVPEVCILFGSKLYRGNRTTKINSERFDAFKSYNYPVLAEIGIHIHYNYDAINYSYDNKTISASTKFCTDIAILKLFPGINTNVVDAILNIPFLKGVVLETFGSGNAPTSLDFLDKIKKANDRGIVIFNVTQCQGGSVEMGRYETSREMLNIGVVSGYDITTEAAVTKMMYLFGQGLAISDIKSLLNFNFRGEIAKKHIGF
ncbi:MAG: asparaginase [Bacteroides sp.]|nr:asparaginase [Bacteroides sp.]